MTHARPLRVVLACLFALALTVVLGGGGCANGGSDNATGGDDGSTGDVTLEGGEGGEAGACGAGKTMCGSTCTNTGNDPKNCGKCGNACPTGQVCSMGMCGYSCSAGETLCGVKEGGTPTMDAAAETGTPAESGAGDGAASDATTSDAGGGVVDAGGPTGPYCANTGNDPNNCGACGNVCGTGQSCQNGSCACGNGERICIASLSCIPPFPKACCNSGECTIAGEICPAPGSTCQCPGGERECMATMSCISSNDCCTNADCTNVITGSTCPVPGQACQCSNGDKLCLALKICVPNTDCCSPTDCTAQNVQTYSCSTTSTMAGTCSIVSCKAGCANLDGVYSNGCECCDDTTAGKSCGAATPLGANPLALGGAPATASGVLPTNDGDWYVVAFGSENNTAFHGHIQLTQNAGEYVFDIIQGGCGGAPLNCGEGGGCTSKTDWEESYAGPNPAGDPADPTFTPVPTVGTVYIHVYRANPAMMTCDQYTLSVQE
jgi:hypothetical protein